MHSNIYKNASVELVLQQRSLKYAFFHVPMDEKYGDLNLFVCNQCLFPLENPQGESIFLNI